MKTKNKILALWFLLFSLNSFAGNDAGHGGGGFVKLKITTNGYIVEDAILLDLWEAENGKLDYARGRNFSIPISNIDYIEQAYAAIKKIVNANVSATTVSNEVYRILKQNLDHILSPGVMVAEKPDVEIKFPSDAHSTFKKFGYIETGIGIYDDVSDQLRYKPEFLSAMNETHKAAFLVHEAVYRSMRDSSPDGLFRVFDKSAFYKSMDQIYFPKDRSELRKNWIVSVITILDSRYARFITSCLFATDCTVPEELTGR